MHNNLNPGCLHHLIKGTSHGDIRHNHDIKTICLVLVRIPNLLCLVLRPNRGGDLMALFEQLLKDVRYRIVSMS